MKRLTVLFALLLVCVLLVGMLQAQSGNVWQVNFYNNTNFSGSPVYSFSSNFADFNWGSSSPGPGVPADNFSARMFTTAYFYAGVYRFTVTADDDFVLYINGVPYLNTLGTGQAGKTFSVDVPMAQNFSSIQLDFVEYGGLAYIRFDWVYVKQDGGTPYVPPGLPTPVPPPVSATSVETRYGDYTPCIQQNIHQANCFRSDGYWNSPNLGSIQLEPQIVLWGECTPGQQVRQVLRAGQAAQPSQCSKTQAGWFRRS